MEKLLKFLITGICFLFIISACNSAPDNFEEDVRLQYQRNRGFFFVKIPPALLSFALRASDDQNMADFFSDAKQVGVISFGEGIPPSENADLFKELELMLQDYEYKDLLNISQDGKKINILVKEEEGNITELVTLILQSTDPVMALTLSGDINIQTVLNIAADFDYDKLIEIQAMGRK